MKRCRERYVKPVSTSKLRRIIRTRRKENKIHLPAYTHTHTHRSSLAFWRNRSYVSKTLMLCYYSRFSLRGSGSWANGGISKIVLIFPAHASLCIIFIHQWHKRYVEEHSLADGREEKNRNNCARIRCCLMRCRWAGRLSRRLYRGFSFVAEGKPFLELKQVLCSFN